MQRKKDKEKDNRNGKGDNDNQDDKALLGGERADKKKDR